MLRSPRKIEEEINRVICEMERVEYFSNDDDEIFIADCFKKGCLSIHKDIEIGDEMTGFERIASMPLEEQMKVEMTDALTQQSETEYNFEYLARYKGEDIFLKTLYKWNDKEWEISE